ncbi:MAG: lipoyl(octanoyl) transferase [Chlorobiaceae bacterium]|nr:lipoyl(octanoyl) transferase [Chlorobiaceae bacterium]MBA4309701.1 lipoyl(octanoyl) transferase [Chlorobiaceae bacterium]
MVKQSIFRSLSYSDLGFVDYKKTWDFQKELLNERKNNLIDDTLLLLEHPHTYTLGKTANKNNLIGSEDFLSKKSISIFEIDRGGDITYHGPGQLVGYPIINLTDWQQDTHKYLRALEEAIIKTIAEFGITGERNDKFTGVWINERKIAAIGIKVSRWITMHGFALNCNTDLSFYDGIIPCGIKDKAVTSIEKEIGQKFSMNDLKEKFVKHFVEVFNYTEIKKNNYQNF